MTTLVQRVPQRHERDGRVYEALAAVVADDLLLGEALVARERHHHRVDRRAWLVEQRLLKWRDALGNDNGHSKGVIEGRNVAESHDSRKSGIALRLTDVVDGGGSTA